MLKTEIEQGVVDILSVNGLKIKQILIRAVAATYGRDFPKTPFKDAHCDIVNCFGIPVTHQEMADAIKTANSFFEIIGQAIDIRSEVIVMRPEGLVIYKIANGVPLKSKFRYAVPMHYAILASYAMVAIISQNQNPGK
ncbi:MAG: hypothetical protein Q8P07_05290 [bacterium]|nr:hypothetical protein [bacterium]